MDVNLIVKKIIQEQETIIGPVALAQAKKVAGIQISPSGEVNIKGNEKDILNGLVQQYEHLFGKASVEACKDAIKEINPPPSPDELPDILK